MMDLYINGELCDTFGDEEIVLTKAVNNIGDLQSREGEATNHFDLPLTNKNKTIFGHAHLINSASNKPYTRLPARIEVDGNIQSVGFVQLVESNDVFRVVFFGANADWFAAIGDKSLQDLDLLDYHHLFTPTNVRNARANNTAWDDVYNYPNVDYGEWGTGDVYWYNFYPGMFVKFLLWKILKEVGYKFVGDFWDNNSDLAKEFIPFCAHFKRDRNYSLRNAGYWDTPVSTYDGVITYYHLVLTNTINSTDYNILNQESGLITILDEVELTFRIKVVVTNTSGFTQNFDFAIVYTDSDGVSQLENIFNDTILDGATETYEQTFTRSIDRTTIEFLWLMQLNPDTAVSVCEFEIIDYVILDEEDDSYLYVTPTFNYITLASTLPDVKQKDLLVTFFNQYCLMFQTDSQTNYVRLFGFNDVVGNIPLAKDWSNKIDLSEKPGISYTINSYGQTNKFLYKDDPENKYLVLNPEFGGGELTMADENLDIEKVVFQSEFASVIRQSDSFSGTVRLAWIPKFVDGEEVDCAPYIGVIEFETIHLLTMDGYALETTQPAMHELGFKYLLPTYYTTFSQIMDKPKVVNILIEINNVDIQQLDFSIPVYLDYFEAYFYINEVKQFKVTTVESTILELVRIG